MGKMGLSRNKVIRLVNILSGKNIKVTQRGYEAYTLCQEDGTPYLVNIPFVPDGVSKEFITAIEGFLDHEAGHILFTDFKVMKEAGESGLKGIYNAIEDSYIERMMSNEYPGSAKNLWNVGKFFCSSVIDGRLRTLKEKGASELEFAGTLFVPAVRSWARLPVFEEYMSDKWHLIKNVTDIIGAYARSELPFIRSSRDALRISGEIKSLLSGEEPFADKKGTGKGDRATGKNRKTGHLETDNPVATQDVEAKHIGQPDDIYARQANTDGSGNITDKKGRSGFNGGNPAGNPLKKQERTSGKPDHVADTMHGKKGRSSSEKGGEDRTHTSGEKNGISSLSLSDIVEGGDFNAAVSKAITEISRKTIFDRSVEKKEYVIFTREFDRIIVPGLHSFKKEFLMDVEDSVNSMLAVVRKKLERTVAAQSLSSWSSGHRSGRLNSGALARLTMFGDERAFKRKHQPDVKNSAVSLLIDCSGSMEGERIRYAVYSAYALADSLSKLNIPCEILGFTTGRNVCTFLTRNEKECYRKFDEERVAKGCDLRSEILVTYLIKEFNDKFGIEQKKRLAALPYMNLQNNVDGESLKIAANRLTVRKEARKILIVLSDGVPEAFGLSDESSRLSLEKAIREMESSGMDIVGIGIQSHAVAGFYRKHVVLEKLDDLPTTVLSELHARLSVFLK